MPVSRRRSSVDGVADLLAQLTYVGSTASPLASRCRWPFVAKKAAAFDNPLVRGFKQGAADAAGDADRCRVRGSGWSKARPRRSRSVRPGSFRLPDYSIAPDQSIVISVIPFIIIFPHR